MKRFTINKKPIPVLVVGCFLLVLLSLVIVTIGIPRLRLVGASLNSQGESMAIIEDMKTKKQEVFDIGNQAFNQGKIIDIQNGKIVIEENGQELVLTTKSQYHSAPSAADNQQANDEWSEEKKSRYEEEMMRRLSEGESVIDIDTENL